MAGFVHLHVHSQYSILDGAIRLGNDHHLPVPDLISEIAQRPVKAVALTDHGVMHGIVDFIDRSKKAGIKPIVGCEFNVSRMHPDNPEKIYHLTGICRTNRGYLNALEILSKANIENYDEVKGFGTIKFDWLREHAEGLTILSGDLGSELAQTVMRKGDVEGVLKTMIDTFDPGNFYLEIMQNSFEPQKMVNECYKQLSRKFDIPLVATNDVHYIRKEEALAHAVLVCMALEKRVDIETLKEYVVDDFYLKTDEEMYEAFKDVPEACENTLRIAADADANVRLGPAFLPQFHTPKEFLESNHIEDPKNGVHEYFKEVARSGLVKRLQKFREAGKIVDEDLYWKRLEREISVITQMDFPGYFLIVWDFIHWSKTHGIPVGPGRGSGAGSLVAYSMTITDIDPMPFSLLFERFLNPERVSMPDFDVDFCMDRRTETIDYVRNHYGLNNVAQIATFGALKAKAALNSVGRVMNFLPSELRELTKLVPTDDLKITLQKTYDREEKFRDLVASDAKIETLYRLAQQVEELFCQTGMHAAGIVISEGPLWDYVPVFRGAHGEYVAQYAKTEVEEAGLIKFDFLGLKTLTTLQYAVMFVNQGRAAKGEPLLDLGMIPLDDQNIYRMISTGRTANVFQIESVGFTKLMMKLKPSCFEDIIAAVALFRPGPMASGMVDQFVDCKHGREEIKYPHERLAPILKETYGVFVYQEQVMQAGQVLSGFSLGRADIMRRAMGKKKPELLAQQRTGFVDGAIQNGVDGAKAGEIFDLIEKFAGYGFNKSHSAAYAFITYQEAYLKYYYPVEHCCAHLICDQDNPSKVIRTINDAKRTGIKILPPDINESEMKFSVVGGHIRFGLAGIKGVGEAALQSVFETRRKDGPFKSLFDFCARVDAGVNKKVIESLIMCGAFDSIWPKKLHNIGDIGAARASMTATVQKALDRSRQTREERASGQASLFSLFAAKAPAKSSALEDRYDPAPPWREDVVLENEFNLIGYFVSGHPLDHFRQELDLFADHHVNELMTLADKGEQGFRRSWVKVTLCGLLKGASVRMTKSGKRMASGTLEDLTGQVGFVCFQNSLEKIKNEVGEEIFSTDRPVMITGGLKLEGEQTEEEDTRKVEVMLDSIEYLSEVRSRRVSHIQFVLTDETVPKNDNGTQDVSCISALQALLSDPMHQGETHSYFKYVSGDVTSQLKLPYRIKLSDALLSEVVRILGFGSYQMR